VGSVPTMPGERRLTPPPYRPKFKVGNSAGGAFRTNGDLWLAHWVTMPSGKQMIMVTVCGFRDRPDGQGREKVTLDRWFEDPPPGSITE
jgi:hypothetical protein